MFVGLVVPPCTKGACSKTKHYTARTSSPPGTGLRLPASFFASLGKNVLWMNLRFWASVIPKSQLFIANDKDTIPAKSETTDYLT